MRMLDRSMCWALVCLVSAFGVAQAGIITPADTAPAGSTFTTGDGLVTLNAYSPTDPLTVAAFSGGAFIGVAGGNNANAVDDVDGLPETGADQEAIEMLLDATVGFSQMVLQWSRAAGPLPTDGVQIAGFTSDPGAVLSTGTGTVTYDVGLSSVFVNLPWTGGTLTTLDVADLTASAGQTLRVTAGDSGETGPQAAIVSISYEVIPEPSVLALLAMGLGLTALRRRR